MAKIKGYSYLLNEEGQPIQGADISIYLANSSTPAKIYTSETGSTAISAVPQLATDEDGYFEFGLGYDDDDLAYGVDQKFKISGDKTGVTSGYNDYITIIPATAEETWEPVNEEGFDTTRNKAVSDNLARGGEDHRTDLSYYVHGIEQVDESSTNIVLNKLVSNNLAKEGEDHRTDLSYYVHGLSAVDVNDTDITLNKLVSNSLAEGGEDHRTDLSYYVHGIEQVDELDGTDDTKNKLVSDELAEGGEDHRYDVSYYVHGLSAVNINSDDITLNKLVSNNLAKEGEDHRTDVSYYVHGLSAVDVNDDDDIKNKLVSNNDINTLYNFMNGYSYTEFLSSSSFTPSGAEYYTNIVHNLNDEWPIVGLYDYSSKSQYSPNNVVSLGLESIRIGVDDQQNYTIKIIT